MQVPDESLLMAELVDNVSDGKPFKSLKFSCLSDTWRAKAGDSSTVARGKLLDYLNPVESSQDDEELANDNREPRIRSRRVIDRTDLQMELYGADKD
jgi:hypothetical protein